MRKKGTDVPFEEVYKECYDVTEYNNERVKFLQEKYKHLPSKLDGSSPTRVEKEAENIKRIVTQIMEKAPPRYSFDFHETDAIDGYYIEEYVPVKIKGLTLAFPEPKPDILAAVSQKHPVAESHRLQKLTYRMPEELPKKSYPEVITYHNTQMWYFSTYMRLVGARSFLAETPVTHPLNKRIEMNTLAVEQILFQ